jgi:hypothetical protein
VVRQLVGDEFFGGLAHEYAAHYPSSSGDLNQYGTQFAPFLGQFAPARALPYLGDMAALEWACHRAHYAADAPHVGNNSLGHFSGATTLALTLFAWHPAVSVLSSAYPIAAIWLAHQQPTAAPTLAGMALDAPAATPQHALVWRAHPYADVPAPLATMDAGQAGHGQHAQHAQHTQHGQHARRSLGAHATVIALTAGQAALLRALEAGQGLGEALFAALHAEPAFELGEAFTQWVAQGVLVAR